MLPTTLETILYLFCFGSAIGILSVFLFGLAVRRRDTNIAPRCTARPADTIYSFGPFTEKNASQNRGNPFTGWVNWTLKLSYGTMLKGIPGTGTRANGIKGKMLDVNLDGIVLLRFHVLCSKVALLTTILALGVVLPINLTAQCFSSENGFKSSCLDPTNAKTDYTNYMRTTLANIPPSVSRYPATIQSIPVLFKPFVTYEWGGSSSNRLYGIVLCAWIIYYYACTLLQNEWKEVLALRRVYYLENDLWARRKRELEATIYASSEEEEEDEDDEEFDGGSDIENNLKDDDQIERTDAHNVRKSSRTSKLDQLRQRRAKRRLAWIKKMEKKHNLRKRNPWIPPPEQRETVPNIELYSVLVGGLPCLPSEVLISNCKDGKGLNKAHSAIDWQLELVSSFFNHCVPTQPGYSSSVAAVTILPDAPSLARAWRRWYTAAAALRRLRFIRTLISEIRYYNFKRYNYSNGDEDFSVSGEMAEFAPNNQGYVDGPLVSSTSALPNVSYDATPDPFAAEQNPLNNTIGYPDAPLPQNSIGVVPSSQSIPALSNSTSRPRKLTADDRGLTTYTEKWWKENQATSIGQHFMHTCAQQAANQEEQLSSTANHFFIGSSAPTHDLQGTLPSLTFLNNAAPDPDALQLDNGNQNVDPSECAQFALSYYRNVFGADDNFDVEAQFFQALQFGPEQSSVYSRELAQSAANCCPYGCGESRLRRCGIDELIALEREAVIKVHNANIALQCAQARAAVSVLLSRGNSSEGKKVTEKMESRNNSPAQTTAEHNMCRTSEIAGDGDFHEAGEPGINIKCSSFRSPSKWSPRGSPKLRFRKGSPSLVPKSLEMEWELLKKENARKEILSNNSFTPNHAAFSTASTTYSMENTDGSSLPPPPPISRRNKTYGGGFLKASSVRFSQQRDTPSYSEESRGVGLVKSASARFPTKENNVETSIIRPESYYSSEVLSKTIDELSLMNDLPVEKDLNPYKEPTVTEHKDNGHYSYPPFFNNPAPITGQHPEASNNRERGLTSESADLIRERCLTSDSAMSSGSLPQSMTNARRYYSRWTGLALTSEGTVATRRIQSCSHNSSNIMNNAYENCSSHVAGKTVASNNVTYPSIEDFDPYAVRKHKKSDGDDLESHLCQNSLDNAPGNDSKRSLLSRRKAKPTSTLDDLLGLEPLDQWAKVEQICHSHTNNVSSSTDPIAQGSKEPTPKAFDNGVWDPITVVESTKDNILSIPKRLCNGIASFAKKKSGRISDRYQSNSTYAVVTFTNRQAALAARHLVADGRGANRWIAVEELPVPPLADSASCDLITCRGCCRPLSLSVSNNEKMIRKWVAMLMLAVINIFYCFPMTAAASLVTPQLFTSIPYFEEWLKSNPWVANKNLAGIVQSSLYSLFFALCPLLFKAIANAGSNAPSVVTAEDAAINYFWWFMVVTAFSGTSLMAMGVTYATTGQIETAQVLLQIAATIPTGVSATWINWIILHSTLILPNQYLLQFNSFVFQYIGWNCCARSVMGGGPGGNIPYRLYIDSCVVLMCTVALSPASPIVAPCALLYFLILFPLLRRNCIFVYRPKFDGGGHRWKFLFQACITSMLIGQVLLSLMMGLKKAIGPALMAALPIPLTLVFRSTCLKRFCRAFQDAGLLQTSLLDQWDTSWENSSHISMEKREEFRRFLVDAHKAAYIPVCIAGDATASLTVEPAVVVPTEFDFILNSLRSHDQSEMDMDPHVFHGTSFNNGEE